MDVAEVARREGPKWLDAFVEARYFSHCSKHRFGKSERNFFCTDCSQGPLCAAGVRESHASHFTLQARKASYKDAIRINDVQRILDISAIETYIINGAKIVFLHRRPQANPPQGVPSCEVCKRSFRDQVRFCSIQCKLETIRRNGSKDTSLTLHAMGEFEEPKMDNGMIINPPLALAAGGGGGGGGGGDNGKRTVMTNFRVHGEQLIRNLTPPRKLWNFLGLERTPSVPMQELEVQPAIMALPSASAESGDTSCTGTTASSDGNGRLAGSGSGRSSSRELLPGERHGQSYAATATAADTVRLKHPQAIQHKGKRIIPLTGRLLSQFSLNSWLNECRGKRKYDDTCGGLGMAPGDEDVEFSFIPPARPEAVAAVSAPAATTVAIQKPPPSIIIPKARRIIVDSHTSPPSRLPAMLHSPTTSSHSDLSSEAQARCCMDSCCQDCTCLTLNSSHSVNGSCIHSPCSPPISDATIPCPSYGRKGIPPHRAPLR